MIHGNLAKLFCDRLELTDDLLQPLGFRPESDVSGFLYLRPDKPDYEHLSLKIDLGLTPIPYRLWPFVARISVSFLHMPGSLFQLTKQLESMNVNVLNANIVRFGHRYAEWDMIVDLSNHPDPCDQRMLKDKPMLDYTAFDDIVQHLAESIYNEDQARIKVVESSNEILTPKKHGNFLFHGLEDKYDKAIQAKPIFSLWQHYRRIQDAEEENRGTDIEFRGQCENGFIRFSGEEWDNVLVETGLSAWLDNPKHFNHCIGSFDSRSHTLRIAVIPEEQRTHFRQFSITYQRENPKGSNLPDTTQGVLRRVTACLEDLNLWWMTNQTIKNYPILEKGNIGILVEFPAKKVGELELEVETLRRRIYALNDGNDGFGANIRIKRVNPEELSVTLKEEDLQVESDLNAEDMPGAAPHEGRQTV